jgi:hypothetical protein
MMRSLIILLALVFAVASAGTILCEIDCEAGRLARESASMIGGATSAMPMHCHNQHAGTQRQQTPEPHGNPGGNTKDCGVHGHGRIVATANAKISVLNYGAAAALGSINATPARASIIQDGALRRRFSSSIGSPSIFASGVLRI